MAQALIAIIAGSVLVVVMTALLSIIIGLVWYFLKLPVAFLVFLTLCLGSLVGTFILTRFIETENVPLAGVIGSIAAALPFVILTLTLWYTRGFDFAGNVVHMEETVVFVVSGAIGGALGKYRRDQKLLKTRAAL